MTAAPIQESGISAMDQIMIDSFQRIAETVPKALVAGQEMRMRIGTLMSVFSQA
jgi:hypothetical protein